jgi:hypothetical protein
LQKKYTIRYVLYHKYFYYRLDVFNILIFSLLYITLNYIKRMIMKFFNNYRSGYYTLMLVQSCTSESIVSDILKESVEIIANPYAECILLTNLN